MECKSEVSENKGRLWSLLCSRRRRETREKQVESVGNFLAHLLSLHLKQFSEKESAKATAGHRRFLINKVRNGRDLVAQAKSWLGTFSDKNREGLENGRIIYLEHLPVQRIGFLFQIASHCGVGDWQVTEFFPSRLTVMITDKRVFHKHGEDCWSALMDDEQPDAWQRDMIDRRPENKSNHLGCRSVTCSCREARHHPRGSGQRVNKRCPRSRAQEQVDEAHASRCADVLGSAVGSAQMLLEEELGPLHRLQNEPCHCLRCPPLTLPARLSLSDQWTSSE